MSLSICLVTRDAADRLNNTLRSVADLGAEVIVADTGSTDGTVALAQAHGASVLNHPWHNDFAAAQNQALDAARGDWVFWLNPDETLQPYPPEQLAALLARPDVLAYAVRVQEVVHAAQPERCTETWQPRLFRRHAELRYVGRLHPHFIVPLETVAQRENRQIGLTDLVVRRHAYLSILTEDKLRWATRLLELELRDRPGQLHYLIEYGRNLLRLNDAQGHAVLAEAAELVLAASAAPVAPTPTVASLLEYLFSVSPQQSRSRLAPAQARELALRWFATSPPMLWQLAHRSFQAQDFRDAALLLERAIELGRTGTYDRSMAFDPSIMAEPAVLNLARCHVRLGELDRAEAWFSQLLGSPTHQVQAQQGCDLVRSMRQRRQR